jgi:hypothetical protein
VITAAGRYAVAIEAYHHDAKLCDGPSISASGLKKIADCPAKFWATSCLNPNRFPPEESKALDLGRAAHALVLGEPEFAAHFIISPYDDFRSKDAREWRDAQTLVILKSPDFETVRAMADAQRASPVVMQAFEKGEPEVSLIWKDAETGIWLKSRPDWLPHDPQSRFLVDYKTAVTIEPRRLSADAFKFGYHVQAALQLDAVQIVLGIKRPLGIAHVVQEKEPPYLADLRMFGPEQLDYGRLIYRKALRRFADCLSSGKWPGYTTEPQYFETPFYILKEMENHYDDSGNIRTPEGKHTAAEYYAAG